MEFPSWWFKRYSSVAENCHTAQVQEEPDRLKGFSLSFAQFQSISLVSWQVASFRVLPRVVCIKNGKFCCWVQLKWFVGFIVATRQISLKELLLLVVLLWVGREREKTIAPLAPRKVRLWTVCCCCSHRHHLRSWLIWVSPCEYHCCCRCCCCCCVTQG